jgi:hypothetical protein
VPRYRPRGPIEAHKTDEGDEYVILAERQVLGVLEADLFDRVFTLELGQDAPRGGLYRRELEEDNGGRRRPTVADGIRVVVNGDELPGVPHVEPPPPAERLAAALAARTEPGGPGAVHLPRTKAEVERAIAETRKRVKAEGKARAGAGFDMSATALPYGAKVKPGESAGKGRKVCRR